MVAPTSDICCYFSHRQPRGRFVLYYFAVFVLIKTDTAVLHNNYFKFGEKVYRQNKGIAMGNRLAPLLVIVFMDHLEREMLRTTKDKPESYERCVDDGLVVWPHGKTRLVEFMDHCNHPTPNIGCTWDSSTEGNSVKVMD